MELRLARLRLGQHPAGEGRGGRQRRAVGQVVRAEGAEGAEVGHRAAQRRDVVRLRHLRRDGRLLAAQQLAPGLVDVACVTHIHFFKPISS